ncbi:MAG: acetoacetate--CoA ligase [Actinomycetota bacterium]|nr:acetoacetate--CoA ligase [Actinomycetota bacterium]
MTHGDVLWTPPNDIATTSRLGAFLRQAEAEHGQVFGGYEDLWRWSTDDLEGFWGLVSRWFDAGFDRTGGAVLGSRAMPGARWFPGATCNYAGRLLQGPEAVPYALDDPAVVSVSQGRDTVRLTRRELVEAVGAVQAGLRRLGIGPGDRVVAYLPNIAETVVAFLATASLGAVWASCAPEFGTSSVVARFQQIEPKVLLAVDGYRYGTKDIDRRSEVAELRAALPSLAATVVLPYLDPAVRINGTVTWSELTSEPGEVHVEPVPFDHPLYVLYSSGTTGLPKPIVHGHGGILLEHLKALGLHQELGPGDVFFWFSTAGWMMWNYLVSGLAVGATIVCFDGDPAWPGLDGLWQMAGEEGVTSFGTSAPFLMACRKADVDLRSLDLGSLAHVGSTGAPLPAEGFEWVYDQLGPDVVLTSISGGTDVCSAFVGGSVLLPVRSGVIAAPCLGVAVEALSPTGESLVGEQGELVISQPMPSMPVGFWGDDDGSRYRAAYFERFPGRWHHGDWITVHPDLSCVISGRSDATLNRGGVRLGTADFYTVVEAMDEVQDSLVVHLEDPDGGAGRLLLFVVLAGDAQLDDALVARLATALRTELSPRHVPDEVHAVPAVPRTLSGKKLEVPVKRILLGQAPDAVASSDALADPSALDAFRDLAVAP